MPTRKTTKKTAKKASKRSPKATERVKVQGLRTLADVEPGKKPAPKRRGQDAALATRAIQTLEKEFEAALVLKQKLSAEARIGGEEKGRASTRQAEKLRSIVMSLEGMNRFALMMKLITPAESRELYARAMKRGLYDGWR
jgi:hypothetical protein